MTDQRQFQRGDVVSHPRRPEWGRGVVKQASSITYRGGSAQRVAVEFANKGRVVINTAIAPLALWASQDEPAFRSDRPSQESLQTTMNQSTPSSTQAPESDRLEAGWLNELENGRTTTAAALAELPEAMTDPFASLRQRLEATLESYRFTNAARPLIDWAVVQTGLDDPLSRHTRHELEQAFDRFTHQRDRHLRDLVRQIKASGEHALLHDALRSTNHPRARTMLHKLMR